MKKYVIGAAALLFSAPAFAAPAETTNLTGAYVGIYGGFDWSDFDRPGTNLESNDWEAGLYAGYKIDQAMSWSKGYLFGGNAAIEGFYGISNADSTIQKDDEWGVSFRPGLSVLDSINSDAAINPYLILGYRNTEFDGAGSDRFDGFELGIGTEFIAFGNAGLRVDYSHVWYASQNGVDPDSDDVRVGLSYHF